MAKSENGKSNGSKPVEAAISVSTAPESAPAQVKPDVAQIRDRILSAVGQVVLSLSAAPRYRHQPLGDLQAMVLEPLIRDRIAIASARKSGATSENDEIGATAGIAIWASVSDEVEAAIREQIKAQVFPIRLKPEDWTSGNRIWLLDVIAPSMKLASSVLANFKQVLDKVDGGGEVRIHPIVARQVDPELLKKMGAAAEGAAKA